ncbi:MAG: DUF362 domain-containing protein [Deltaproteobacteria bacterium]|nr:DUF362 domain-containing protein [Deltaproteobacteria bacterium]
MKTSIVRYKPESGSIANAIQLCDGLSDFKRGSSVLIKPNCVFPGSPKRKPAGTVTNAPIMTELVEVLKDAGAGAITIGEGTIVIKELKTSTMGCYRWAGFDEIADKYGVSLQDFNEGPYRQFEFVGHKVKIAEAAFETDFLIDLPVLKTHTQTRVSLGVKNLKGFLSLTSRKIFHQQNLEEFIALLGNEIKVSLCIIDGIYGLQKGPFGEDAKPFNLIIAGRDVIATDMVGSEVMGIDHGEVVHLRKLARHLGHSFDLDSVEIVGENIEDVRQPLEWWYPWTDELLKDYNIEGLTIKNPGTVFCSGCTITVFAGLRNFLKANAGSDFGGAEICIGDAVADEKSNPVVLLGKCPMAANKSRQDAISIKGCPVGVSDVVDGLTEGLC